MFYVFPRVIKPDVCNSIVKDYKQNILKEASVLSYDKFSRDDPSLRKTSIHFITDEKNKVNEIVWHFLRKANKIQFNYDLTFFQAIQFAEYKDGGFYGWHQDASSIDPNNETRKLSLTLVLSDPNKFEGGELQFFNGERPMAEWMTVDKQGNNRPVDEITGGQVTKDIQAQGTVVVFDSRDWHRVTPVTDGVRHSIVCWCLGANFK